MRTQLEVWQARTDMLPAALMGEPCVKVFGISDLHLPFVCEHRLSSFGRHWLDHEVKIAERWDRVVGPDDAVLVPGDISWAPNATRAKPDMDWLAERPGQIYVSPGNHDRWWRSEERLAEILPEHATSVHSKWRRFYGGWIASTVGMTSPDDRFFGEREQRKWPSALRRLQSLLDELAELRRSRRVPFTVLLMHYPPCSGSGEASEMATLVEEAEIDLCLYGHLHRREEWLATWNKTRGSTTWRFVSCDALDFEPLPIARIEEGRLMIEEHPGGDFPEVVFDEDAAVDSATDVVAQSTSVSE